MGTPPEEMDPIFISSSVGVTRASVFTFVNPLHETVNASVSLPSQGQDFYSPEFELSSTRKARQLLAQGESFDIAFDYVPKSMTGSETKITIELGSHGKWVYPIKVYHPRLGI
jgi:hypothetical protein